ncbi:PQQ-like beta-propeller repeat protein [bacterium]|nr:PQQ-like beta-propeller repeat protein [bacterium]MBU1637951.1 PQQ-like beta-propeller repeat protein [bacterium]MBU1920320.1 PQQ-like beta-propeller repeat protein [bacterium]
MMLSKRTLISVVLFAVLSVMSLSAAEIDAPYAEELWKASFEKDIRWQQMMDCGYLLVSTDDALNCLDPADGSIKWQKQEFGKLPQDYLDVIAGTPFAAIMDYERKTDSKSRMLFINIPDGRELWNSEKFAMTEANGQLFIPELDALFIVGKNADKEYLTALVDIFTGYVHWTSTELFSRKSSKAPRMFETERSSRKLICGNQEPLVTPDGNILEFISEQGLRKLDAKTGTVLWTWPLKVKEVPSIKEGWAPMMLSEDSSIVYVPFEETLQAVNISDGSLHWGKKGVKTKGQVKEIKLTPAAIVIKGHGRSAGKKEYDEPYIKPFINALAYETGKSIWRKPFKKLYNASSMTIDGDRILLHVHGASFHGEMLSINIADGVYEEAIRKTRFNGNEFPQTVEALDDGYLMTSASNIAKYDMEGNELWHYYYKPLSPKLLTAIAMTAMTVLGNNISEANAMAEARRTAWVRRQSFNPDTVQYETTALNEYWRLSTSKSTLNYLFIATNVEGGKSSSTENAGLIKVSKETGQIVSRVTLGNKEPQFEMDALESRVFYQSNSAEITCYRL